MNIDINKLLGIHEFSADFIPGVIFLYGLNLIYSNAWKLISHDLSIGSLILFSFLAYGAGHVIQALGNVVEKEFIEPYFCDLKKQYEEKEGVSLKDMYNELDEKNRYKIDLFKSHGKIRRGIATGLLFLLIIGWVTQALNPENMYISVITLFVIITLYWYMRRAEVREIKETLKFS